MLTYSQKKRCSYKYLQLVSIDKVNWQEKCFSTTTIVFTHYRVVKDSAGTGTIPRWVGIDHQTLISRPRYTARERSNKLSVFRFSPVSFSAAVPYLSMFAVIHARILTDQRWARHCARAGNCAPDFRVLRDVIPMSDREVANLLARSISHLHTLLFLVAHLD